MSSPGEDETKATRAGGDAAADEVSSEIRRERDRYAAVFAAAPFDLIVVAVHPDGRFVYEDVNPTHTASTGVTPDTLLGRTPEDVFGPVRGAFAASRFRECVETGRRVEYEITTTMPRGEVVRRSILVPIPDAGGTIGKILIASIDLTETRRTEAQLARAQRLEAIGQLTGGIAHDFNNLLTAILGNIELVQYRPSDPRTSARLEAARAAARRGGHLTHQLLAHVRNQPLPLRAVAINEALRAMTDLLRRSLGGLVEIEMRAPEGGWHARTDPTQFELAVLNLAINARDAMPAGGRLMIRTNELARGHPALGADVAAGDYVAVIVSDTGSGMPKSVMERAFDPFFTTKEIGKGTGLGLAQVDSLARRSGGLVRLSSTPGAGTTVTILLPRAEPAPARDDTDGLAIPVDPAACPPILVVDDDADVRAVAATMLEDAGFPVREAASGDEALSLLADGTVDFALVDFAMPGMSGTEFLRRARLVRPGLRAAYLTGYSDPVRPVIGDADTPVVRKPYNRAELLTVVTELVNRGTAA